MGTRFEQYRKKFIEENDFYEKEYLPEEEQEELRKRFEENEIEDNPYEYERTENGFRFYVKKPAEVSESILNQYILMKTLDYTKAMDEKQNTMKNIMIFWLILTIINLIGLVFIAVKIGSAVTHISG